MIILTVLTVCCFIAVGVEMFKIYRFFAASLTVDCRVTSSEKKELREDGYLVKSFWLTSVSFEYNGTVKESSLETSTFCHNGQSIKCCYNPDVEQLFRKRDFKKYIRSTSPVFFSIGIMLLVLNFILTSFNIDNISKINIAKFFTGILTFSFTLLGTGSIVTALIAIRNSSKKQVEHIKCCICDIVRKTSRHKENKSYTYYPIYKYTYKGEEHVVQSKIGNRTPPKKNSIVIVPVSRKKGGPVEYKDTAKTFIMGIVFLILNALIIFITTVL